MTETSDTVRLNKHLALVLGISRRAADELITANKVMVNGTLATLGSRLNPGQDAVTVSGKSLQAVPSFRYVLFNKPVGYVCSRRKQGENETIYTLLPPELHTLNPVGRLDRDSSGLLLLTNDGDFAYRMTHPKFHKTKIYEVMLDQPLQPLHRQMISDFGVMLPDGKSKFELERLGKDDSAWRIIMSEGRNRQIRRTFGALGYVVTALHRTHFGDYALGDIPSGDYIDTIMR